MLLAPGIADADVVVTVSRSDGTDNTVTVDPAVSSTFSVDVNVDTGGEDIVSLEARLRASTGGVVAVSGGAYGPEWDPGLGSLPIPTGSINDTTDAFGSLPLAGSLSGTSRLATLELEVDPQAPHGVYALNLVDLVAGDLLFREIDPPPQPGSDFLVVVGPRPVPAWSLQATLILTSLLLAGATAQIARRRAAAA